MWGKAPYAYPILTCSSLRRPLAPLLLRRGGGLRLRLRLCRLLGVARGRLRVFAAASGLVALQRPLRTAILS